jgi:hypothetical protein
MPAPQSVSLLVEGEKLVAVADPFEAGHDPADLRVRFLRLQEQTLAVLDQPVAFFITEHIPDPSRRAPGEELWVEVTVPRKGPPRPIRLGVRQGDGPIVPLELG